MAKRRKKVELPNNLRGVLARNLETVLTTVPALNSQPKIAAKGKLGQSSVGRVFRAEVAVNLDNVEALAKAANVEPWQLLVPDMDPLKPPRLGAGELKADELEMLNNYRRASGRWKLALRHMSALQEDTEQEEVASGVTILMAEILGRRPYPVAQMSPGWKRPDAASAVHSPRAKYEKTKK